MGADPEPDPQRSIQLIATGVRLRLDGASIEALAALEAAGVPALLLKGATTAAWLYSDTDPRAYLDCDLLIGPGHMDRAAEVLAALSYRRHFDERRMPEWWREHAAEWVRGDGITIDLHGRLSGIGVQPTEAWRVLTRDATTVDVLGYPAPALSVPARAVHLVLHAAHHGAKTEGPLGDLARALDLGDVQLWDTAAGLARELSASDAFAAGLALTPGGAELAARLGFGPPVSVRVRLLASSPPPLALGFEQLFQTRGLWARASIIARKVVPPAEFIRRWDPRAADGRLALLAAYARRPFWLIARAPAGFRAWGRERRGQSR